MGKRTLPGRRAKLGVLRALKSAGIVSGARRAYASKLRIICYHGLWLGPGAGPNDAMFISTACFRRRLELIGKLGYRVVPLDEALARLAEGRLEPNSLAITIDDGWYGTYAVMLPILEHMRMPAALYCDTANLMSGAIVPHVMARYLKRMHLESSALTEDVATAFRQATDLRLDRDARTAALHSFARLSSIDVAPYLASGTFHYMSPDDLERAGRAGLDIQLHTHTHTMRNFVAQGIAEEIETNRAVLADVTGRRRETFKHLAYPSGDFDQSALLSLRTLGVASATTLCSGLASRLDDPLLLPRLTDSGSKSELEFEADLAGVLPWYDALKSGRRVGYAASHDDYHVTRQQ